MLFNYLKIALRNLAGNRLFSIISVGGVAVSLASCMLIGMFVWDELKFDRYHPDGHRTYRIYDVNHNEQGTTTYLPIVPYPVATYLIKDFPEVESAVRLLDAYGDILFEVNGKRVLESHGVYSESGIFQMLTLSVVEGTPELDKPNSIALSASLAKKHFPNSALGESIVIGENSYLVTAVYSDPPTHTHIRPPFIISLSTITKYWKPQRFDNWVNQQYFTYVKLKEGTDEAAFGAKLIPFMKKYGYPQTQPEGFTLEPHLQRIADIHLFSSRFEWEIAQRGNAQMVYILAGTAILLLVISCFNFINLSTARAIRRMKEVGVRKVVGAARRQLIMQFISESVLITFCGLLIAILIVQLALPSLNSFSEKELNFPTGFLFAGALLTFTVILGIVAGSYPAFYLSAFKPVFVLARKNTGGQTAMLRQSLVVLQFAFSFFLITGSLIVLSQNDLLRNKDLGFTKDHLVSVPLRDAQLAHQDATKAAFADHDQVISATICFGIPGDIIAGDGVTEPSTKKNMSANLFCVDYDYVKTLGMRVIAGRDFSRDFPSDKTRGFILNETAVKAYGFNTPEQAIGRKLDWSVWGKDSVKHGEVIGVVQDFHFKSLRDQMTPAVIQIAPDYAWKLVLRLKSENLTAAMDHVKKTYEKLDPEYPFTYQFVDQNFDAIYKSEEKLSSMFSIFTGLAILVACLGLFGLVEYSVNQRMKEVSIRKVFGASVRSLFLALTGRYFVLILIAFVIVIPLSYYAASEWLRNFAYHVEISPWIYLKACALLVLITILTVSYQSLKAAFINPANVLRSE